MTTERIAMVAITRHGAERLATLGPKMPEADLYISQKFADLLSNLPNRVVPISIAVREAVAKLFASYDQLLFVFSIGAAVRLISPCLKSKEEDPGVVVVDDAGRFVVPILSGHLGGANAFATEVATLLNAVPVMTTASESLGTLPVDILGRELGWQVEAPKNNLVRVAARVVNGEPIAFIQEMGSREWWPAGKALPDNIYLFETFEAVDLNRYKGLLWVTERHIDEGIWQQLEGRLVVYRPPQGSGA
ncbi:MAG: cobalamin biosynthesis protein CbiG [Chromatiales bacterium]|nr:cobalamin biosynthesis protein CbiG [Chromatiales bacterium]